MTIIGKFTKRSVGVAFNVSKWNADHIVSLILGLCVLQVMNLTKRWLNDETIATEVHRSVRSINHSYSQKLIIKLTGFSYSDPYSKIN